MEVDVLHWRQILIDTSPDLAHGKPYIDTVALKT